MIRIDDKALLEANVALDKPVSVRAANVPLSSLLDMILRPLDLNWLIADDLLTITTKDVADDITEVRVYPVRDLVIYGNGPHGDFNRLIESIQSTIKPDSWSVNGGPGAVEPFYKNYSSSSFVPPDARRPRADGRSLHSASPTERSTPDAWPIRSAT